MGRRSVSLEDQDRWVFNRLAGDYLARPAYPDALVERLAALAGGPGGSVADLGAGVGHLALPLAARGLSVTAVEPARTMLTALARLASARGLAVAQVHAAAEATGLTGAAFDLVLVADALQWVDPERGGAEAARLLRPEGAAALVEARFAETPFMTGLAALFARENPRARPRPPGAARHLLALAAPGAAPVEESFRQDTSLDPAALTAVLRSLSFAGPALAPARLEALRADAAALGARCGGARFTRELTLRWARRGRRRSA
jgi:SAM-dependent methyltransferase